MQRTRSSLSSKARPKTWAYSVTSSHSMFVMRQRCLLSNRSVTESTRIFAAGGVEVSIALVDGVVFPVSEQVSERGSKGASS